MTMAVNKSREQYTTKPIAAFLSPRDVTVYVYDHLNLSSWFPENHWNTRDCDCHLWSFKMCQPNFYLSVFLFTFFTVLMQTEYRMTELRCVSVADFSTLLICEKIL